ncbi:hypothetical protein PsorP6_016958 [Peronosclerospora sorghi]|uniref:Uncharacterized protein n=1 Tax=Peronosclerospora sorghi TaxID=230839 RepID=A0ACC0WC50_9STRA|nr:hypothetical protein PsorP6_016958 [Peronosclerospora sorghi]
MPPSKKQKTMKLESQTIIISDSESKPDGKEMISAEDKITSTKKDNTSKSSREKGTGTKTNSDDVLTAIKIMPTSRIVKKNMDIISDDVKGPVLERAKANALAKTKENSDKTKPSAKLATSETELSSSQSSNLLDSPSQKEETASETEGATQSSTTVKSSAKTKKLNENENFRKILVDKTRRIADGKKTKDANPFRARHLRAPELEEYTTILPMRHNSSGIAGAAVELDSLGSISDVVCIQKAIFSIHFNEQRKLAVIVDAERGTKSDSSLQAGEFHTNPKSRAKK